MTKKALDLIEYGSFAQDSQLDILQKNGVYVGKRKLEGKVVVLYQLSTFYVEITYSKYRRDIKGLNVSDSPDILQPYLKQVTIRDLDIEKK